MSGLLGHSATWLSLGFCVLSQYLLPFRFFSALFSLWHYFLNLDLHEENGNEKP